VTLGSVTVTSAGGTFFDVILNPAGIAYLQANLTQVALGGTVTTLTKGAPNEALFNSTNATLTRQLILTTADSAVPEPSSFLLIAAGLGAVGLRRRQARG
jgi:hypothetical protein